MQRWRRRQDDLVGDLIKELTGTGLGLGPGPGTGRLAGTKSKQGDKQQEAQEQKPTSNWGTNRPRI